MYVANHIVTIPETSYRISGTVLFYGFLTFLRSFEFSANRTVLCHLYVENDSSSNKIMQTNYVNPFEFEFIFFNEC